MGPEIEAAIARVLEHGRFVMGPEIAELEERLAERLGVANVITCSSGSDALILVLKALGVGPGDVVFVPSFTFAATVEAVVHVGATPCFVEIDRATFNVDIGRLDQVLEGWSLKGAPRAVIAVDLFGQPADYASLREIGTRYDLIVIDDAAQSFGARTSEGPVGTLARATTTSFFPAKPLGAYGDGGAVITDDADAADAVLSLRVHGSGTPKYHHDRVGYNARLDTLQASILLVKLAVFEDELQRRRQVAANYHLLLNDLVEIPQLTPGSTSSWAQYTVRTPLRDKLAASLKQAGIPTAIYYPMPLHTQAPYAGCPRDPDLSLSTQTATEVLSLPMHPYLTEDDQERVAGAIRSALGA